MISGTTTKARILVVDDHPLVRRGIVQSLESSSYAGSIQEAANENEALAAVWNHALDLVILDISLPGRGGLEVLKEIRAARPRLPVLILSMHPEGVYSTRALRSGAAGYLTKESPPETLHQAITHILKGGRYITPTAAEMLASELSYDSSKAAHESLSDREYDVMLRIGSGQSVSQIAETLHLSVKTISTYRTRVLRKMALKTNADLVQYAIRGQLIK